MEVAQAIRCALRQLRKSPEFAITAVLTLALGASRGRVLGIVMARTAEMVSAGIAAVTPVVPGRDAWGFFASAAVLFVIGMLAVSIPARRAATVEPMQALRNE